MEKALSTEIYKHFTYNGLEVEIPVCNEEKNALILQRLVQKNGNLFLTLKNQKF